MNTRTMLTLIAFGGSLAALVACSSSDAGPYASSDEYCSARATAECNGLAKSCGTSLDACNKARVSVCTDANSAALAQGRSYHSENVQACLDSINSTFKDNLADYTPDEETATNTICDRVYIGSKQQNDTCANTYECSGDLICDKTVCAIKNVVALKGGCNNPGDVCDTGAYCQQQGQLKFCVAENTTGQTCSADAPCTEDLRCVNTCVARVPAGGACDTDDSCGVNAPYCDPSTKKCRPKYQSDEAVCQPYGQ